MKTEAIILAVIGICLFGWIISSAMEIDKEFDAFEADYQHIVPRLNYNLPPTEFIQQIGAGCEVSDDVDECVKTIYADTKQANDFAQNVDVDNNPYIITNTDLQKREDDIRHSKWFTAIIVMMIALIWIGMIASINMDRW